MKKKMTFCILVMFLLIGCGQAKKSELEIYKENMETFYKDVSTTSESMNSIDMSNPENIGLMLSYLDDMNNHFIYLKDIEIPKEYENTSSYVTNAYSYMNQSVILYHQALESEIPDADLLYTAKSYYDNSMECVSNIGKILESK